MTQVDYYEELARLDDLADELGYKIVTKGSDRYTIFNAKGQAAYIDFPLAQVASILRDIKDSREHEDKILTWMKNITS